MSEWTDQFALIIGANSELGKATARAWVRKGVEIVAVDTQDPSSELVKLGNAVQYVKGTFTQALPEIKKLVQAKREKNLELLILLEPGISSPKDCESNPKAAFTSNVALTFEVLEFAKKNGCKRFLFASDALVYGDRYDKPVQEFDEPKPESIYAATVLAAEGLVSGFARFEQMSAAIIRLAHIYGPDATLDTPVGKLLTLLSSDRIPQDTNQSPTRDFLFIDDAAEGIIQIGQALQSPGPILLNLGTGLPITVESVSALACKIALIPAEDASSPQSTSKDGVSSYLVLNIENLKALTNWNPRISIEEGLKKCLTFNVKAGVD